MPTTSKRPDTIVLVHGFWVTPRSWEHWIPYYEAKGYKVLAPAYPGFEVEVEALNRDPSQPFLSSIGIPVFFRCAGADPKTPKGLPRPIKVPAPQFDLRIALTASKLVVDKPWLQYVVADMLSLMMSNC